MSLFAFGGSGFCFPFCRQFSVGRLLRDCNWVDGIFLHLNISESCFSLADLIGSLL